MKALHLLESPGVSPGPAAGCMDQPSLDFPGKTPLLTLPPAFSFFLVETYCLPPSTSAWKITPSVPHTGLEERTTQGDLT